jgi:hypothetical protein
MSHPRAPNETTLPNPPVLATTNCVLEPPKSYKDRLFTTNEAGLTGVKHIGDDKDFGARASDGGLFGVLVPLAFTCLLCTTHQSATVGGFQKP